MNKSEFVEKQAYEVRELVQKLKGHRDALEERVQLEPDDDRMRDYLEDAEEGVDALEPVLVDYEKEDIDPEELVKYAEIIEDWQRKETEIAEALQK